MNTLASSLGLLNACLSCSLTDGAVHTPARDAVGVRWVRVAGRRLNKAAPAARARRAPSPQ
jgi:hypothetical protein